MLAHWAGTPALGLLESGSPGAALDPVPGVPVDPEAPGVDPALPGGVPPLPGAPPAPPPPAPPPAWDMMNDEPRENAEAWLNPRKAALKAMAEIARSRNVFVHMRSFLSILGLDFGI